MSQETDPIPGARTGLDTSLKWYLTLLRLSDLIVLLELYGKSKMEESESDLGDGASIKVLSTEALKKKISY